MDNFNEFQQVKAKEIFTKYKNLGIKDNLAKECAKICAIELKKLYETLTPFYENLGGNLFDDVLEEIDNIEENNSLNELTLGSIVSKVDEFKFINKRHAKVVIMNESVYINLIHGIKILPLELMNVKFLTDENFDKDYIFIF